MKITTKNNSIFIDGKRVSNFCLSKVGDNLYEIDNGKQKTLCEIKYRNLNHFRLVTFRRGMFCFTGNTKDMNAIMDLVDSLGLKVYATRRDIPIILDEYAQISDAKFNTLKALYDGPSYHNKSKKND